MNRHEVHADKARRIGDMLGGNRKKIDLNQFQRDLVAEFEHGMQDPETKVTVDDIASAARIAWTHVKVLRKQCWWLERNEAEADGKQSRSAAEGRI